MSGLRTHRQVIFATSVLVLALGLNLVTAPGLLRGALLLVALGLCAFGRLPLRAAWPLAASGVAGGLAVAGAFALDLSVPRVFDVASRTFVGVAFGVWFAHTVSWPALRDAARAAKAPTAWLDLIDTAQLHMAVLGQSLERRWRAGVVRGGFSGPRRQVGNTGLLLAGTVVGALDRAHRLEEAAALRGAGSQGASDHPKAFALRGVRLGDLQAPRLHVPSLDIGTGTWMLVAGASGAGKSTLLRTLAGLETPEEGAVWRFGRPVVGRVPPQRVDGRVALVFQDPEDQFFALEVGADLAWGLRQRGIEGEPAAARVRQALDEVGLATFAARPIATLSFGERKRLALAGALVTDPDVLLCDEPTMGLDAAASRLVIEAVMKAGRRRAMTVLWATHDLDVLPARIGEAVLLRAGQPTFVGARDEALDRKRRAAAGLV